MNVNIIKKVLAMFDDDTELKINKLANYNPYGYHWTFNGTVDGGNEMMKLTYDGTTYRLLRKKMQEVTEELEP